MKTMAEVLAEHQQKVGVRDMRSHCWCGWAGEMTGRAFIEHQAAALTAAGFGPVREAQAQALRDAAEAGRDPSVKDMDAYHIDQADVWLWLRARAAAVEGWT